MKSFTTIVVTVTCLFFIGELGAKYLLVEVDGMNDNKDLVEVDGMNGNKESMDKEGI